MYIELKGRFRTSGNTLEAKEEIEELLGSSESLLRKGAPLGHGARIEDFQVEESGIDIDIISDRYVRSHDAMLRLRKPLSHILGKHRIGIRGIEIDDYTVRMPADKHVDLYIPWVKESGYKDGNLILSLSLTQSDIEKRIPDRIISLVEEKLERRGKKEYWELLWESGVKETKRIDPTEEMVKWGWIKRGTARGQWIFGPEFTELLRAFEQIAIEYILEPLGYVEMIFPKLVTWDIWKKSGHAKAIYPEIYYICPPKTRDPSFWEDVMDYYKVTNEIPSDLIKEKIGEPIGGLCYAQCPPFWTFLQGETIAKDSVPVRIFDRSGTSHRYESGGIHGIERVDEFHRIELVWIDTRENVINHSKELREKYMYVFDHILDIQWREAWVTPWFMQQEGKYGLADIKEVGTVDYEAILPYNGDWLEFQNLSINGDKYPRGFNVKYQTGEELWSGCSGIGLERWCAVFLAQKGLNPDDWPPQIKSKVDLPEAIKFV